MANKSVKPVPPDKPLTRKQARFMAALPLASSNTAAAITAGYSPASAAESASENLRKSNVAIAIAEQQKALETPAIMAVHQRKERLSELARLTPDTFDPIKAIDVLNRMERIYAPEGANGATGIKITVVYVEKQREVIVQESTESKNA